MHRDFTLYLKSLQYLQQELLCVGYCETCCFYSLLNAQYKTNINISNIVTIIGSDELSALSVRYCNSRYVSEKIHTHFHS